MKITTGLKIATLTSAASLMLAPVQSQAFWNTNKDPDTNVPSYSNIKEACINFHEKQHIEDVIDNRVDPFILKHARRARRGEITREQYREIIKSEANTQRDAEQRALAASVAVLRAAGYRDWKMYSRYAHAGIADMWDKHIIAGDRVAKNKSHPDYKYTYMSGWSMDVYDMCKPYK